MTIDALGNAGQRLNALQASRPDAVRLAEVASLAVRIDAYLLRQLRLQCLPGSDVGTEADLWFSRLVESRGTRAIVLDRHIVRLLRQHLVSNRPLLEQVVAITLDKRRNSPPALRLEERINAELMLRGETAVSEVDLLLEPAVRSLKTSHERGREIAQWWLGAAPRLHPLVWHAANALALLIATSVLLRRRVDPGGVPLPSVSLDQLGWALPLGLDLGALDVDVELGIERLTFRTPREERSRIEVPATIPPLVDVEWTADGMRRRALVPVAVDQSVDLGIGAANVTLRTLSGAIYRILLEETMAQKRCFVSMPFGVKTDYRSGRSFDMDATYRSIIKPAVESAGMDCVRADEIAGAAVASVAFEQLLSADVVIADLSTASVSVAYELGMRHALRPSGTIVIADAEADSLAFLRVWRYGHSGKKTNADETARMQSDLTKYLTAATADEVLDSPFYGHLTDVLPPVRIERKTEDDPQPIAQYRRLLQSISDYTRTAVREVMTPRPDIVAVRDNATLDEVRALVRQESYSQFPVYSETLDNVIGFFNVRDLLFVSADATFLVTSVMRPAQVIPETKRVLDALAGIRKQDAGMAIVVDEYGGTAGLVTLSDLVEDLVGPEPHVTDELIVTEADGSVRCSGTAPIADLSSVLGVEIPPGGFETVGGWVLAALGRVPVVDEQLEIDGLSIKVLHVSQRRIRQVLVRRLIP
ncbi:MAG: hemolysin family protein [Vicinamibacterales bacterium]